MMKKLGKTLIVIALALLIADYAWGSLLEPGGSLIQLFYLTFSYRLARIFSYLGFAFTNSHMELFWLGIALWFVGRKEST